MKQIGKPKMIPIQHETKLSSIKRIAKGVLGESRGGASPCKDIESTLRGGSE